MPGKALLVNLPPSQDHDPRRDAGVIYPATGILVAGTLLKESGLDVRLIDGAVHSDYADKTLAALDKDTLMLGLSVMTNQVPMALELCRRVKARRPDLLIVWGGIHPILFPEQTLVSPLVDMVVTGEGVRTIRDLAEHLQGARDKRDIRGIAFKDDGKAVFNGKTEPDDFSTLPHFDFSLLEDIEVYLKATNVYQREMVEAGEHIRILPILSGLGCAYKCQFCINVILKRRYRRRSAEDIIAQIKRLQADYGANAFVFFDEDFLINKNRFLRFLELIEQEDLRFKWRIWARVSYFKDGYLDKDLIERLERAGLRSFVMGGESGSQDMLDLMQKGIRVSEILRSARMLRGTQITPRYSFMVGYDQEKREDTRKTYRLCAELQEINPKVDIAGPFIFRCYPGSAVFDKLARGHDLRVPKKLEDWSSALSPEGFLKVESLPWAWKGCLETAAMLSTELVLADRLKRGGNPLFAPLLWLFRFRAKHLITALPLEYHAYLALKKLYRMVR